MSLTVYINGKFAAQPVTGVQRFASELTRALDRRLGSSVHGPNFVLLTPKRAPDLGLRHIVQRSVACRLRSLHVWEQLALPRAASGGLILNLTGSAPFGHPNQIASILDTAIYDHPQAYTQGFVAWYRLLFALQARRARLLVTLTEFSRAGLQRTLRPRARVVVVNAAADQFAAVVADEGILDRLDLRSRRFILAVGSSNPTKNFSRLRDAFAAVLNPSLALVIVGGDNANVFAGDDTTAQDPRIIVAGRVTDAELKALYSVARGFVFPSLYEGFGIPPIEAMIAGCPVAASTAASIPEVCGDAALYFNPTDTAAMTVAIEHLADDGPKRAALIAAGRRRAADFSWDISAATLFQAIDAEITR